MSRRRMARPVTTTNSPQIGAEGVNSDLAVLPAKLTKQDQLIALLRQKQGASLVELAEVLGWLPHTTRAALTGLRKKGHQIIKRSADNVTRYRIAEGATT